MMPDRRLDPKTRGRLDTLEKRWLATERRLHRAASVMLVGGLVVALGVVATAVGVWVAFGRIQASRQDVAYIACVQQAHNNASIHSFVLRRSDSAAERVALEDELERKFPTIKRSELVDTCRERARDRVDVGA